MLFDVDAAVIENRRLSDDYSVLVLDAPEIAAVAQPGQFVMVKPTRGSDPLLRRPFSIFEVLRDRDRRPVGDLDPQQADRRRHVTALRHRAGQRGSAVWDRSAGRSNRSRRPPRPGWSRAASASRRSSRSPSRCSSAARRRRCSTARARAAELYYVELFEQLGVHVVLATEDGSRGTVGRVTAPLADALSAVAPGDRGQAVRCADRRR